MEFTNELEAIIFFLEQHLVLQHNMERELKLIQKLGEQDELVKSTYDSLMNIPNVKSGLEDVQDIHAEFHRVINRAKLGAIVNRNAVQNLNNYSN